MTSHHRAIVQLGVLLTLAVGCSAADDATEVSVASESLTACPMPSNLDDQQRAAATVAFNIMRGAAKMGGVMPYNTAIPRNQAALAPQRYRVRASGVGIEFDPTDPLFGSVNDEMKAELEFAQLDSSVAQFLSDGLKYAHATTNGWYYPSIRSIAVLSNYTYPGPTTSHIPDPTSSDNSHYATATGEAWCGTSLVKIDETVKNSWQFAPLWSDQITTWRTTPPAAFKGYSSRPSTPFNGPSSSGNPYLVVSVNGQPANWAAYNFTTVSCYSYPNATCRGSIEIDPVPYAEPGAYYNVEGLVGTQANPYALSNTVLYAAPEHMNEWATRTVNGVREWGRFVTPVVMFGSLKYKYVKMY